ncbi:hypothetical protein [Calycomorphotria hydatis]|nr:hypothetical protein [Calycomorphotria hydatis]
MILTVGIEIGEPIHIIVLEDTFSGKIENLGSTLNTGLGHQAVDGDLLVDENDGTLITYRVPDLSGTPKTAIVGEKSFDLSKGRCFVLGEDYQATQMESSDPEEAISLLAAMRAHD